MDRVEAITVGGGCDLAVPGCIVTAVPEKEAGPRRTGRGLIALGVVRTLPTSQSVRAVVGVEVEPAQRPVASRSGADKAISLNGVLLVSEGIQRIAPRAGRVYRWQLPPEKRSVLARWIVPRPAKIDIGRSLEQREPVVFRQESAQRISGPRVVLHGAVGHAERQIKLLADALIDVHPGVLAVLPFAKGDHAGVVIRRE